MDKNINKMYELFGWDKNTLIIIVSDHGEEFWDYRKVGHGYSLNSEVLRVPFLIYFSPEHHQQKRIRTNVSNMDVMPTVSEYLQLEGSRTEAGEFRGKKLYKTGKSCVSTSNTNNLFLIAETQLFNITPNY